MKKLSLEMLRLTSDEVLGRSQMMKITGGVNSFGCSYGACGGRDMIKCCDDHIYQCSGPTGTCVRR